MLCTLIFTKNVKMEALDQDSEILARFQVNENKGFATSEIHYGTSDIHLNLRHGEVIVSVSLDLYTPNDTVSSIQFMIAILDEPQGGNSLINNHFIFGQSRPWKVQGVIFGPLVRQLLSTLCFLSFFRY